MAKTLVTVHVVCMTANDYLRVDDAETELRSNACIDLKFLKDSSCVSLQGKTDNQYLRSCAEATNTLDMEEMVYKGAKLFHEC